MALGDGGWSNHQLQTSQNVWRDLFLSMSVLQNAELNVWNCYGFADTYRHKGKQK